MSPTPADQQLPPYRRKYNSLAAAVEDGDRAAVRGWLGEGADPNEMALSGMPVLVEAALRGQNGIVALLLAAKADIEGETTIGERAIHWAASRDHADVVKQLLDKGATIDAPGYKGITALMLAAKQNSTDSLALLLERGADYTLTDKDGLTALDWAVQSNNTQAADMIKAFVAARAEKVASEADKRAQQMDRLRDLSRKHKTVLKHG